MSKYIIFSLLILIILNISTQLRYTINVVVPLFNYIRCTDFYSENSICFCEKYKFVYLLRDKFEHCAYVGSVQYCFYNIFSSSIMIHMTLHLEFLVHFYNTNKKANATLCIYTHITNVVHFTLKPPYRIMIRLW